MRKKIKMFYSSVTIILFRKILFFSKLCQKYIIQDWNADDTCRRCKYITSECQTISYTTYKLRYDKVVKILHHQLAIK